LAIIRDLPRTDAESANAAVALAPGGDSPPATPSLGEVVARLEAAGYRGQYELHLPHQNLGHGSLLSLLRNYRSRLVSCLSQSAVAAANREPPKIVSNFCNP